MPVRDSELFGGEPFDFKGILADADGPDGRIRVRRARTQASRATKAERDRLGRDLRDRLIVAATLVTGRPVAEAARSADLSDADAARLAGSRFTAILVKSLGRAAGGEAALMVEVLKALGLDPGEVLAAIRECDAVLAAGRYEDAEADIETIAPAPAEPDSSWA
jgi:hypothetical protein